MTSCCFYLRNLTVTQVYAAPLPFFINCLTSIVILHFKFSADVRKVIYTTNAIESLNSGYRRLNKQRSVFPSDTALLKALYLATHEITKKWTMPLRNWSRVLGELEIMYPDRQTDCWRNLTNYGIYCIL